MQQISIETVRTALCPYFLSAFYTHAASVIARVSRSY